MIVEHYPSIKPEKKSNTVIIYPQQQQKQRHPFYEQQYPTAKDIALSYRLKIVPDEVLRRDKIVKQLWQDCPFHVNQKVTPKTKEHKDKYGAIFHVKHVIRTYHDMSVDEPWPKDDIPFIMTIERISDKKIVFCNAQFLDKA